MTKKTLVAGLAVAGCMFSGGYVMGQQYADGDSTEKLFSDYTKASMNVAKNADLIATEDEEGTAMRHHAAMEKSSMELAKALNRGTADSDFMEKVLAQNIYGYKASARIDADDAQKSTQNSALFLTEISILQAVQNQRLIEQNDRIIAVLEEANK